MGVGEGNRFGDGFSECNSRFTGDAVDIVFSLHSFYVDVEVKFSHSGNDGLEVRETKDDQLTFELSGSGLHKTHLLGLGINVNAECRVLLLESVQSAREVRGFLTLWSNCERNDGFRNEH